MKGRQVTHRVFGTGTILELENGKLIVDFSGVQKTFPFPAAFSGFLATTDATLTAKISEALKAQEEDKQRQEEERLRITEAAKKAQPVPPSIRNHAVLHSTTRLDRAQESIAFKCNFCDGGSTGSCIGFRGKCSDQMIHYNIERAKHVWCSTGSVCKRYYDGYISRAELDGYRDPSGDFSACSESDLLLSWRMGAGYLQNGMDLGKPLHINRIRPGSLAVLTTRKPSDREPERFIFAASLVNIAYGGDDQDEGYVTADPVWRIELAPGEAERLLFWKYYYNAGNPERIVFGSGLFRYLTDIAAAQILRDIAAVKGDAFSGQFFSHFCEIHEIEPDKLGPPNGALM